MSPLPLAGEADARSAAGEGMRSGSGHERETRQVLVRTPRFDRPHPALSHTWERGTTGRTAARPRYGLCGAERVSSAKRGKYLDGRRAPMALTLPSPASGRGEKR